MNVKYALEGELFEELMPQKTPMLFCDGIAFDDEGEYSHGSGYFTIGQRECVALDENKNLPQLCLIEVMSQAIAGLLVYKMHYVDKCETKVGLFLSIRAMKVVKNYPKGAIPAGITLKTKVKISNLNDGVVCAEVETEDAKTKEEIASARLSVFSPNKEQLLDIFNEAPLSVFK